MHYAFYDFIGNIGIIFKEFFSVIPALTDSRFFIRKPCSAFFNKPKLDAVIQKLADL